MIHNDEALQAITKWWDHLDNGDLESAWPFMHPDLRLALVQDWVLWAGPDTLSVRTRGNEEVARILSAPQPTTCLTDFGAFGDRLLTHWEPTFAPLRRGVRRLAGERPMATGDYLTFWESSEGNGLEIIVRADDDYPQVLMVNGESAPVPGWPPVLGGTIGAGHADARPSLVSRP